MQNKNMISIFVCMLLIAVPISSVAGTIDENETLNMKNDDYNNLIKQVIEQGVISNNDWLEDKLLASDGDAHDEFGGSVSVSDDYALIGASHDDSGRGSAYVFKRSGTSWTEEAKLVASDGAYSDLFGVSVSISGDYALIGAYGDDDNGDKSGSAYVFKRSGTSWLEEAKLVASDGASGDRFGVSVSIDGDYAVIGAYHDDDNGVISGSAYVFKRDGTSWTEEAKLVASDGASGDRFGVSVSIDGDYAIIGAELDDDNGQGSGSAYIFKRESTSWTEQAKLLASDGAEGDLFGWSVSIDGDYALIGAPADGDMGNSSGSAYVFKRSGTSWLEEAKLVASDGTSGDAFGVSVSVSGDYALIGVYYDDSGRGSAYVFKRSGTSWTEEAKLVASDGESYDWFGRSVSVSGDYALIGAPYDDDNGDNSGSAYIFKRPNQPPNAPTITGETNGKPGTEYEYTFNAVDPDGDNVKYHIDWDDGDSETTDFFSSGIDVKVKHTWTNQDTYIIRVTAEDTHGLIGPEGTLTVTMPRNRATLGPFLYNFLQQYPILYQLLLRFLQL